MSRLTKHFIIAAVATCAAVYHAGTDRAVHAQNLTLVVDPYSGTASIQNSSASPLLLDGYQVTSASGALVPDSTHTAGVGWDSFANAGLSGWQEFSPTIHAVSELNLSTYTTVPASGSLSIGHPFSVNGTQDLAWGYSAPSGTGTEASTNPAPIVYAGGLQVQAISVVDTNHNVLSTNVVLLNQESSQSFNFDAYMISSPSGSLGPANFNGYAGRGIAGWQSIAPSANALTELNLSSSSTLAPGHDQVLGPVFATGGTHDLSLGFHVVGTSTATLNGTVLYRTMLNGDVNGDGVVNGLDISQIASNWLATGILKGDVNFDGVVNGLDIALVASNWLHVLSGGGSGTAAAQVPEPATIYLCLIGLALCAIRFQNHRFRLATGSLDQHRR